MKPNAFVKDGVALVARVRADADLRGSIERAVGAIGGFCRAITPGDTVLLKPNLNTADPPPASSDPLFLKAVIELLYAHGAQKVFVGESSMLALSTARVLRQTGVLDVARDAGAEVAVFDRWVNQTLDGKYLKRVSFARAALEAPKLVYATALKTHRLAEYSNSLKLAVAFVRPRERILLHLHSLAHKIAELNTLVAPDLILTDARRCFISGGPSTGVMREPGLILASGDRIAVDVEGVRIIQSCPGNSLAGKDPWQLAQIRRAVELGLGARGPGDYAVVEAEAEAAAPSSRAVDVGPCHW